MPPKSAPGSRPHSPTAAQRVRRLLVTLHLVLGLSAGLLVSLLGLTGSLLVFRHEIDALTAPVLRRVTPQGKPAPLDQVVLAVHTAEPGAAVRQLFLGEGQADAHEVWLGDGDRRVYVDPYSARVLGFREDSASFTGRLFALHTKLLAGETGEKVAGWGGLALLALSLSGIALWWPARVKYLADRLRVKWRASALRVNYDLHRTGGFYAAGLLALLSLTGSALVFDDAARDIAFRLTGSAPPAPRPQVTIPAAGPNAPAVPLAGLLAKADAALPGGVLRRVSFPAKPGAPVVVRKRLPGDLHPNGMGYVYLDPYTGGVLRVDRADAGPAGQRLMNLRYPLHIGHWGGLASRLVHALVGLMPALLFVTGFRMWWRRWRKRAATRP